MKNRGIEKEILKSVELLWTAAQNKKGRNFTAQQVAHLTGYLNELSVMLMQREKQVSDFENKT